MLCYIRTKYRKELYKTGTVGRVCITCPFDELYRTQEGVPKFHLGCGWWSRGCWGPLIWWLLIQSCACLDTYNTQVLKSLERQFRHSCHPHDQTDFYSWTHLGSRSTAEGMVSTPICPNSVINTSTVINSGVFFPIWAWLPFACVDEG